MAPRTQTGSGRLSQGLLLLWGKCAGGSPGAVAAGGGRLYTSHHPARSRPPTNGAQGWGSLLSPAHRPPRHGASLAAPRPAGAAVACVASGRWQAGTGHCGHPPPGSSMIFLQMTHKNGWGALQSPGLGQRGAVRDRDRAGRPCHSCCASPGAPRGQCLAVLELHMSGPGRAHRGGSLCDWHRCPTPWALSRRRKMDGAVSSGCGSPVGQASGKRLAGWRRHMPHAHGRLCWVWGRRRAEGLCGSAALRPALPLPAPAPSGCSAATQGDEAALALAPHGWGARLSPVL